MALLEMKNISKSFFGAYANKNISMVLEKGQIHALLGENGAGKTTLMNILFGLYTADEGEIFLKGKKLNIKSPSDSINAGIGMVQQHFSLVQNMTVLDNIILNLRDNKFFINRNTAEKQIIDLSDKYGLSINPRAKVSELSTGEQQRVEIIKALFRNIEILILDEPTGVLTPKETKQFFNILRNLKEEGFGIIIITHRMSEIMEISDVVTVLREGEVTAKLSINEADPQLLSKYMMGTEVDTCCNNVKNINTGKVIFSMDSVSVKNKQKRNLIDNVSITVRAGEILGIAGVFGNGQRELAEAIIGIRKISTGKMLLNNENILNMSIKKRYEKGISYIPDDRHSDGLVMDMNISNNMVLREYSNAPYSRHGFICSNEIYEFSKNNMENYRVKTTGNRGSKTQVKLMSGGNQQKLILARELNDKSKLIIACQPTRGLDIGATMFVRNKLISEKLQGKGVILISADLEEILSLSDRVAVLFGGKILEIVDKNNASVHRIGLLMGGVTEQEAGYGR